jgi:hypothetical protein
MTTSRLSVQTSLDVFLASTASFNDVSGNLQSSNSIQQWITKFLTQINSNNYLNMLYAITVNGTNASSLPFRIMVTYDDGSVAIDLAPGYTADNYNRHIFSNIGLINATGNTQYNTVSSGVSVGKYMINENHMSRPEIMLATLGNNGVGYSKRYSSSSNAYLQYVAYRVGNSTEVPSGCIRASVAV